MGNEFAKEILAAAKEGLVIGLKDGIKDGVKDGIKDVVKGLIKDTTDAIFSLPKKLLK